MESYSKQFSFLPIPKEKCDPLSSKDLSKFLEKWGLKHRIDLQAFALDQPFHPYQKQNLLDEFFSDPIVLRTLKLVDDENKWHVLGVAPEKVFGEFVPCTATSMDLFNRLENNSILRAGGNMVGCVDEFVDGIQIADELRKMLIAGIDDRIESDHCDLYTNGEQDEFLFRLFRHLCFGGNLCQFEDNVEPYLDAAKQLYKDTVSVVKDPAENKLVVTSSVYKVNLHDPENVNICPDAGETAHPQTFAYVIISPQKKRLFFLYHRFLQSSIW